MLRVSLYPAFLGGKLTFIQLFMEFDFNTSALVRDALPNVILRPDKKTILIRKYSRDTRDTYEGVRRVSREIWGGKRSCFLPEHQPGDDEGYVKVDLILHLGMIALGWNPDQFRFETTGRRDGYELAGDNGKHVDSDQLKELGLPESLTTAFDIEAAWRKVRDEFPGVSSCVSTEFRLYSSLAEPLLTEAFRKKKGRVVFERHPKLTA
ncbi:hypothetical protein AJ79_04500 [Helicocarpus griseus UAMH5409]|uniref:Uncharacterized protein n=1 Tax=Helicocarpus griseus UAMH5409 TaxID=1447875 RepID=A0A2B7XTK1_9EURO|nr:hypothetical protein AJ79_04500 [Helicocarpus griseus UAMH5409]